MASFFIISNVVIAIFPCLNTIKLYETPQFTSKDERDIQKKLTEMIDGLSDDSSLAYLNNGGTEIDEEDAELIRSALERTLRRSKLLAKEKFTPKKYRK